MQHTHHKAWVDRARGVRVHYVEAGNGPKVVLLIHGAPQTWWAWRHTIEPLVAAGYRVIVPDYRGAGDSSKPRDGFDKWTMAGDLHHVVHEAAGVQGPVSVVGHDLGATVALAYALRYRDDVVSLTASLTTSPTTPRRSRRTTSTATPAPSRRLGRCGVCLRSTALSTTTPASIVRRLNATESSRSRCWPPAAAPKRSRATTRR